MPSLGVLGTLVYDRIYHPVGDDAVPIQQWGGLAYSLAAFSSARPASWEVFPLAKVGEDLKAEAEEFLRSLPGLRLGPGFRSVPEATNRVELRYIGNDRRQETLTGGVPGWSVEELRPLVSDMDALYVNFISGSELDLQSAQNLRSIFDGPMYADLHSLFLGPPGAGPRTPERLRDAREWLGCFDAIQLNSDEAELLDCHPDDFPRGLILHITTRGPAGAVYRGRPSCNLHPMNWRQSDGSPGSFDVTGESEIPGGAVAGDPTGCGDVWGSVFFSSLLAGREIDRALRTASRLAACNVRNRDIRSLRSELEAELEP